MSDYNGTGGQQRSVDTNQAAQTLNDSMDLGLTADDLGIDRQDNLADLDLGADIDPATGDAVESQQDFNQYDFGQGQQPRQGQQPGQQQPQQAPGQQPGQQPQPRPLAQGALVQPDARGNLVDGNGNIIARAGAEARHYQRFAQHFEGPLRNAATAIAQSRNAATQSEQRVQQAVQIGEQLLQQLNTVRAQVGTDLATQYGITKDEHLQALNFARTAKTDPIAAIKQVLTLAASRGIDLKSVLGPSAANALDPKSLVDLIRAEIGTAVQPLKQRTEQESAQQNQQQERQREVAAIQQDVQGFFNRTPEAQPFFEMFRAVKTNPQYSNLSMDHVWTQIQLDLARRGHTPQTWLNAARQQRGQQNGGSMPAGGRPRGGAGVGPGQQPTQEQMAPVSTTYEQIVRELLG